MANHINLSSSVGGLPGLSSLDPVVNLQNPGAAPEFEEEDGVLDAQRDPTKIIGALSDDVMFKIFSYLPKSDLRACARTCSSMNVCVETHETYLVKKGLARLHEESAVFIGQLMDSVESQDKKEALMRILSWVDIDLDAPPLPPLNELEADTKNQIIHFLADLSEKELTDLKNRIAVPTCYSHVFTIAQICKGIPAVRDCPNEMSQYFLVTLLVQQLIEVGAYDQAFEIAKILPPAEMQFSLIEIISGKLAGAGDLKGAIKALTDHIDRDFLSASSFLPISNACREPEHFVQVIAAVETCLCGGEQRLALGRIDDDCAEIVQGLLQQKSIGRAIDLAEAIPNESIKIKLLKTICQFLVKENRLQEVLVVANAIPKTGDGDRVRHKIAITFAEKGRLDDARQVGEGISDHQLKASTLSEIVRISIDGLIQRKDVEGALEMLGESSELTAWEQSRFFLDIAKQFIDQADFDRAVDIVSRMRASWAEQSALYITICDGLIAAGNRARAFEIIAQAISAAERISGEKDPYLKEDVYGGLAAWFVKMGEKGQAAEMLRHVLAEEDQIAQMIQYLEVSAKDDAETESDGAEEEFDFLIP